MSQEHLEEIRELARSGFYAEALQRLRGLEDGGEATPEVLYLIAAVLSAHGEEEEARLYVDRCLAGKPDHEKALKLSTQLPASQAKPDDEQPPEIQAVIPGHVSHDFDTGTLESPKRMTRPCPHCGERIAREAAGCRACGRTIKRFPWHAAGQLCAVVLVVLLFLWLFGPGVPTPSTTPGPVFFAQTDGQWLPTDDPNPPIALRKITYETHGLWRSREATVHITFENLTKDWIRHADVEIVLTGDGENAGRAVVGFDNIGAGGTAEIVWRVPCKRRPDKLELNCPVVTFYPTPDPAMVAAYSGLPVAVTNIAAKAPRTPIKWGMVCINILSMILGLFSSARIVAYISNMGLREELQEDAVVTLIAVPVLLLINIVRFISFIGTILFVVAIAYFYKRGCMGTIGIIVFTTFLQPFYAVVLGKILGLA